MKNNFLRAILILACAVLASFALGGELIVTSPSSGDFLGNSTTVRFRLTGLASTATVTATIVGPGGVTTNRTQDYTDVAGAAVSGTLDLGFDASFPVGDYTITVTAQERGNPNNVFNSVVIPVTVDTVSPKFGESSPNTGGFVRGIVPIRAAIVETNVRAWSVKVNGNDIPNNTGTDNNVSVNWDTTNIITDGPQTVTITVTDRAGNSSTKTLQLTVDRTSPVVTISYPTANTRLLKKGTITVLVDISDASPASVAKTGIDVTIRKTDGTYIGRVSLVSFLTTGSNAVRWTGRIRYKRGQLPSHFQLSATATDRAGNASTPQEVNLSIS